MTGVSNTLFGAVGYNPVHTDFSSGAIPVSGVQDVPVGDTYRGIFGDWFNKNNIEREDWQRNEQSLNNALARDLAKFGVESSFNREQNERYLNWQSSENKLAFDRSMDAASTYYQRAVADMKKAGINPLLAYSQGSPSTPTASSSGGSAASASIGSSSGGYRSKNSSANTSEFVGLISTIVSATAGLISRSYGSASSLLGVRESNETRERIADKYIEAGRHRKK